VSNLQDIDTLPHEERMRLRKQMSDQAVKLAVSNRWDEAVTANREILRAFGEDADTLNRLGKALSEVGQITEARKSYGRALELDGTNTIARRNLDRLATMKDTVSSRPSQIDTRLFVEESGKAAQATLQAVDAEKVGPLDPGDVVGLQVQGNAVNVVNAAGEYIGMVEPRLGLRMSRMMEAGNQYSAAIVSGSGSDVKVMLRETFQHPSQAGRVSFPQARATDFRSYTRRGLLRGEDMDYGDDDDEVQDTDETDEWTDRGDDLDSSPVEVDIETDDDNFD
jgi:hypothetical protein